VHLYDLPMVFILIGLVLYTVLAGADFGAGLWTLLAGSGREATRVREHAHHSMAPVWEANHVWLIFVLTVMWTAYPTAFGSIASTLAVPLFIAGIGIVLRGAAYALHSGFSPPTGRSRGGQRTLDLIFSLSSLITPFALGAMVGAIASRRVPVGNAAGRLFSSWTGPTSILVGVLAVSSAAYLAAVYLAADAVRLGDQQLERQFRLRALISGVLAGAGAVVGVGVLHHDAHQLYRHLLDGAGLVGLIVSVIAGISALSLVWSSRFALARFAAALAVAAIIAGWALAQQPLLLPGLTIQQAAAPHDTLVVLSVAVIAGGAILFPSLALLFRLLLAGTLDHDAEGHAEPAVPTGAVVLASGARGLLERVCLASLSAGFVLLTLADGALPHAVGVLCLFAFLISGFFVLELGEQIDTRERPD
jgi:cytochrome bd ubiquinol oxidase subunit II